MAVILRESQSIGEYYLLVYASLEEYSYIRRTLEDASVLH